MLAELPQGCLTAQRPQFDGDLEALEVYWAAPGFVDLGPSCQTSAWSGYDYNQRHCLLEVCPV